MYVLVCVYAWVSLVSLFFIFYSLSILRSVGVYRQSDIGPKSCANYGYGFPFASFIRFFLSLVAFLIKNSNDVSNCVMIAFHSLSVTSPMQNI